MSISSAETYQYTPLSGARHIRVLVLHPALARNQPIRVSLEEVDLDRFEVPTTKAASVPEDDDSDFRMAGAGRANNTRTRDSVHSDNENDEDDDDNDTFSSWPPSPVLWPQKPQNLLAKRPPWLSLSSDSSTQPPPPPYEALSYTWGARHGTEPITIVTDSPPSSSSFFQSTLKMSSRQERQLLVTPNCLSALSHLRNRFTARRLWIDAICIDQQSVPEKNQQVPLMGKVYACASRAVIWLGPGENDEAGTMRRAAWTGRLFYFRTSPGRSALNEGEKEMAGKIMSSEEISRIGRICSSVWFQRIWTLQELFLAQSAVFMVGSDTCLATPLYTYFIIGDALLSDDSHERRLFRMRSALVERFRHLNMDNKSAFGGGTTGWLMSTQFTTSRSSVRDLEDDLASVAEMAALNDATDMRDKVYGILSLLAFVLDKAVAENGNEDDDDESTSADFLPKVDYAKSTAEVYEDFAMAMLGLTGSLWPLEMICRSWQPAELPSWVPDLRDAGCVRSAYNWPHHALRNTGADEDWTERPGRPKRRQVMPGTFPEDEVQEEEETDEEDDGGLVHVPGKLRLWGRRFDRVTHVHTRLELAVVPGGNESASITNEADRVRTECLSEWTAIALHMDDLRRESQPDSQATGGADAEGGKQDDRSYTQALERLTRSLNYIRESHDLAPEEEPAPPTRKERWRAKWSSSGELAPLRFDDLYDGAALFRTRRRLIGLCKADLQDGDEIWQLVGGHVPFILRRKSGERRVYTLVGIADLGGPRLSTFWHQDLEGRALERIVLV